MLLVNLRQENMNGKTYMSINASEVKLLGKKTQLCRQRKQSHAEGDKIDEATSAERQVTKDFDFDDEYPF